jgi:hypothetical protein
LAFGVPTLLKQQANGTFSSLVDLFQCTGPTYRCQDDSMA